MGVQPLDLPGHGGVLGLHPGHPLLRHQPQSSAHRAEAGIRVVLAQQQPVLAAAGHHAVGLVRALGDQIVNEGSNVALAPGEDQGLPAVQGQGGVGPGHEALDRSLLVARGAAELPRPVQTRDPLCLQGWAQLQGVHAVVLNGVGRAHHLRPLQAGNGVEHLQLHLLRHGGGEALDVQLLRIQAHGLDEQLVAGLVREPGHLGLNGGAVPGPHPLDSPAVHGGAVQVLPDDPVGVLIGVGEVAHGPVDRGLPGLKGEGHGIQVPVLALHFGEIHGAGVDPGRGAGLEPAQGETQLPQAVRQGLGGEHTVRPARPDALAHNGPAV